MFAAHQLHSCASFSICTASLVPCRCCYLLLASKVDGVDEVQMIVTSADQVRPHVQTVTTYAADFDEVQLIELDADDIDEWQYAYTDVERTVYESQVWVTLGFYIEQKSTPSQLTCV